MTVGKAIRSAVDTAAEAARAAAAAAARAAAQAAAAAAAKKAAETAAAAKNTASSFKQAPVNKAQREESLKALETRLTSANVPADVRTRTLDRLKTLDATDYARETALLDTALNSPNADRAVSAYDRIQTIAASSPEAARRLTPEIRESLVRGVAERRTGDDVGQEGILGVRQAEQAARALTTMPQAQYDALSGALAQAGTGASASPRADPQAERALLLKAVASRADRLQPSFVDDAARGMCVVDTTESQRAMREITDFAGDIRGTARDELIRTTTAIDIEAANTSTIDPNNLPADGAAGTDTRGDNDGLYQRFEDTCGPTTSQMTRAEADPIFARQLHQQGIGNADPTNATGVQQRETLYKPRFFDASDNEVIPTAAQLAAYKKDGTMPPGAASVEVGATNSRRADQAASRTAAAINALDAPDFAKRAVRSLIRGDDLNFIERAVANHTLARLRETNGGHPTANEIRWIQTERDTSQNGMRLDPALHDIASPGTHTQYQALPVAGSTVSATELNDVATRLTNGQDVPIRVSDSANSGGHFMLMSDVRGASPDRNFLVSDPYSGRTAWVREADLTNASSTWLNDKFGLGWSVISHTYPER